MCLYYKRKSHQESGTQNKGWVRTQEERKQETQRGREGGRQRKEEERERRRREGTKEGRDREREGGKGESWSVAGRRGREKTPDQSRERADAATSRPLILNPDKKAQRVLDGV